MGIIGSGSPSQFKFLTLPGLLPENQKKLPFSAKRPEPLEPEWTFKVDNLEDPTGAFNMTGTLVFNNEEPNKKTLRGTATITYRGQEDETPEEVQLRGVFKSQLQTWQITTQAPQPKIWLLTKN